MALWFFCLLHRLFSVFVETLKRGKEWLSRGKRAPHPYPEHGPLVGCGWTAYIKNSQSHLAVKTSSNLPVPEAGILGSLC